MLNIKPKLILALCIFIGFSCSEENDILNVDRNHLEENNEVAGRFDNTPFKWDESSN